jgi:hypothetical protein
VSTSLRLERAWRGARFDDDRAPDDAPRFPEAPKFGGSGRPKQRQAGENETTPLEEDDSKPRGGASKVGQEGASEQGRGSQASEDSGDQAGDQENMTMPDEDRGRDDSEQSESSDTSAETEKNHKQASAAGLPSKPGQTAGSDKNERENSEPAANPQYGDRQAYLQTSKADHKGNSEKPGQMANSDTPRVQEDDDATTSDDQNPNLDGNTQPLGGAKHGEASPLAPSESHKSQSGRLEAQVGRDQEQALRDKNTAGPAGKKGTKAKKLDLPGDSSRQGATGSATENSLSDDSLQKERQTVEGSESVTSEKAEHSEAATPKEDTQNKPSERAGATSAQEVAGAQSTDRVLATNEFTSGESGTNQSEGQRDDLAAEDTGDTSGDKTSQNKAADEAAQMVDAPTDEAHQPVDGKSSSTTDEKTSNDQSIAPAESTESNQTAAKDAQSNDEANHPKLDDRGSNEQQRTAELDRLDQSLFSKHAIVFDPAKMTLRDRLSTKTTRDNAIAAAIQAGRPVERPPSLVPPAALLRLEDPFANQPQASGVAESLNGQLAGPARQAPRSAFELTPEQHTLRRLQMVFARIVGKLAEDFVGLPIAGDDEWDMDALLARSMDRRTLATCRQTREREALIVVMDISGSCRHHAEFFQSVSALAASQRDVELMSGNNGRIEAWWHAGTSTWRSITCGRWPFRHRTILFFGDHDGQAIVTDASHRNRITWFSNETRERKAAGVIPGHFNGLYVPCGNDADLIRVARKLR